MNRLLVTLSLVLVTMTAEAAEPWSVERCMEYAAEHSHTVRLQQYDLDASRTERTRAIGAFLPDVYGSVGAQMNFGRAIDPETNTYTDVNTFYNGYGLQASLVVFDGLQRYNELRMARANVAMGRSALQAEKDAVRLRVYKACMDLLYCEGAVEHTQRKRDESRALLHQVEVMAEVGQKSEADVAQMRATLAADDYELTHMQSQTTKALLALKQQMNFPIADTLIVEKPSVDAPLQSSDNAYNIYNVALATNPRIAQAESSVAAARYALRAARGAFLPTLSLWRRLHLVFPQYGRGWTRSVQPAVQEQRRRICGSLAEHPYLQPTRLCLIRSLAPHSSRPGTRVALLRALRTAAHHCRSCR